MGLGLTKLGDQCDRRAGELLRREPATELASDTAYLLLAAARRLAPAQYTPTDPAIAISHAGAGFAAAFTGWHQQLAQEARYRVLSRAADAALGADAEVWLRTEHDQVGGRPGAIATSSDDGLRRVIEVLAQLREQ
jgi:hypothetical protein